MTSRLILSGSVLLLSLLFSSGCERDLLVEVTHSPISLAKGGNASSGDPTVTATDPTGATQDTTLDVRVLGSGFDRGARADFALDGVVSDKVKTNSTRFVTSTELVANITIAADATVGLYDVIVTIAGGKKGIGTELFAVASHGNPANRESYLLDFSGDIVATDVPATAFPGALWTSLEVTGLVDIRLPAVLIDSKPYNQVNPAECNYSETDPARLNSWGKNAAGDLRDDDYQTLAQADSIWSKAQFTVSYGGSLGPTEGRIDVLAPFRPPNFKLPNGTPTFHSASTDAAVSVSGSTFMMTQARTLVAAGGRWPNPDPHTDPCITFTIVATQVSQ